MRLEIWWRVREFCTKLKHYIKSKVNVYPEIRVPGTYTIKKFFWMYQCVRLKVRVYQFEIFASFWGASKCPLNPPSELACHINDLLFTNSICPNNRNLFK